MAIPNRFRDTNKHISDFYNEVWVICPACKAKAIAIANREKDEARLSCLLCGYNKAVSTRLSEKENLLMAAHGYFHAQLWLEAPFRAGQLVWAYNEIHLTYLEQYISAGLREHYDRTHFTLLEKLPRFYHEAKNREGLLKLIKELREKV